MTTSPLDKLLNTVIAACGGSADEAIGRGDSLFAQGQFDKALVHFLAARKLRPGAEVEYRVGLGYWRIGDPAKASAAFEEALRLLPDFPEAHCELGRAQLALGNIEPALRHARRAVEILPDNKDFAIALASVLEADGQIDAAGPIVERLALAGHSSVDLAMVYSRLAPRLHQEEEALILIARALAEPSGAAQRSGLNFAAANLLDRLGRYDDAFAHAWGANVLRSVRYDPAYVEAMIGQWIETVDRPALARMPRAKNASGVPVFIIGMPRSGTSLVEQILASHASVHGAGELNWIAGICADVVKVASAPNEPNLKSLLDLNVVDLDHLAARYLEPLIALNPAARRITDKMPTNFIYLGLIAILFPQARIIHCRRDPMDTCLSCFMTDFTAGHEFAFNLDSLGHFYLQYERLMAHWKGVIDLPILEVNYEDVVTNVEAQSRRMVDFLGLPWDPRCLAFHENRRFAGTASVAQVRQPIYASSVGRWRHYRSHLIPLQSALENSSDSAS
jgi:tetratricopeptide (TPR) repeat protein